MEWRTAEGMLGGIAYVRSEADGALKNGTRVVKVNSGPGDGHKDGALGTVLGSMGPVDGVYAYFVEWDESPGLPIAVTGPRIKPAL